MSNIISIVLGLCMILNAFRVKNHPERVNLRKPVRWFGTQGNTDDIVNYPELRVLYFVNYLVSGLLFVLSGVLGLFFGISINYLMLYSAVVSFILFMFLRPRISGEIEVWKWVFIALVLVGVVISQIIGYKNSKVETSPEMLSIEGNYGQTIHYQSIDSIVVVNELPEFKYCKEGFGFWGNKKGVFRLKDGTDAKFYLLGKESPYLKLYTHNGLVFVNRKTAWETGQLMEDLRKQIGEKMKF